MNLYTLCKQTISVYRADFADGFKCKKTVYDRAYFEYDKRAKLDKNGNRTKTSFLLVVPENADIKEGDRVFLGIGKDIKDRKEWNEFLPTSVDGLVTISEVAPRFWNGKIAHIEAR